MAGRSRSIDGITFFAVLGEIEADQLVFTRDPEANGEIDEFEQDEGSEGSEEPGDENSSGLIEELAGVAV